MPETARKATQIVQMDDDERLANYKLDIAKDADVTREQRDAANEDMRFIHVKGGMWEGFLTTDFPDDRVKMEFDLVSNFLQRYLGKFELSPVGVEYKPDDGKTTDDDAEMLNGIYRADFLNHSGRISTDNGIDEAATCGYGAMKLATIFEDEEDPENDLQRIEWRPIYNAYKSVYWDEAAQRIDKRDASRCTVLTSFTRGSFEVEYPGKSAVSAYVPEGREFFNNRSTSTPSLIYVAERYEVIKRRETLFIYNNIETREVEAYSQEDHELIKDELRASVVHEFVRERDIIRRIVEKSVFSGEEFLSRPRRIVGKFIPIVPFYGYRSYVDGAEWARGLIRKLIDPQRTFNMEMSQLAENAASAGQEVPIFLRDQMANPDVQNLWANKNNKPYLVVDAATDGNGNVIASGPIAYSKPPQLDASTTALLNIVPQFIQDTTGGVPQETLNPDASGKAIKALIEREDLTTAKVTKNITDAILWSGEIYQAMAAEIYSTQRIIRTIGKEGRDGKIELLKTIVDEETGKMVESNTLKGKKLRAFPDIGPRYETLREQTVEDIKGMLEAIMDTNVAPQYVPALVAVLLENINGVGMDPIKELNRRIMLTQGLIKPETDEDKRIVAQFQQQQQQTDPQEALIRAAAEQQQAEARSLDSSSAQKLADAEKKGAETIEILSGLDLDKQRISLQAEKQSNDFQREILKSLQGLPVQ